MEGNFNESRLDEMLIARAAAMVQQRHEEQPFHDCADVEAALIAELVHDFLFIAGLSAETGRRDFDALLLPLAMRIERACKLVRVLSKSLHADLTEADRQWLHGLGISAD